MSIYTQQVSGTTYRFDGLVELMAKATPRKFQPGAAAAKSGCEDHQRRPARSAEWTS